MKKLLLIALSCCFIVAVSAQGNRLKKLPKKVKNELGDMVYIPGDTLFERPVFEYKTKSYSRKVKDVLGSFYLSTTEVTNADWRIFQKSMETKYGKVEGYKLLPDTNCWRIPLNYGDPFMEYYYMHPGYAQYPVVGVTWNQVQQYIKWKNNTIEKLLKGSGYSVKLRLPTANEFEFVTPDYHRRYSYRLFDMRGEYRCNFGEVKDTMGFVVKYADDDNAGTTAPVRFYKPGVFGLYNIQGNVEEWTSDAYARVEEDFAYDKDADVNEKETNNTRYICKGGSWGDVPYYLQGDAFKARPANASSRYTGFRLAADVIDIKSVVGH